VLTIFDFLYSFIILAEIIRNSPKLYFNTESHRMKIPIALLLSVGIVFPSVSQNVYVLYDSASPQASYAAGELSQALRERNYTIIEERDGYDYLISIGVNRTRLAEESYSIIPELGRFISIYGGDERGMIYGCLALVEHLRDGGGLAEVRPMSESASLEFRAIKFNLPWETYRPSSALDQHYETVRDTLFWKAFLDMMVYNRFNVLSLWNMHPFAYMIMPANFPEASPFTPAELAEWRHLYRSILRMAKERGMDTYIVQWSIFVSREFSEAHGVALQNYYPFYYVPGDTSEIVRRYTRESVTQVLEEYPDLDGFGISHGEGMAGMTPQQRQDWMDDTFIAGMFEADRPVKMIHRVPFSSDTTSDPGVSPDVERITRTAMENLGDTFEGPIWVEMKFNWSHAHSTPKLVKVHGGPLGDTYFVPEPENYKITWMARNEDFFALRWGVPGFIRDHIAENASENYVGGYFLGSETYIPAKDYFTAVDDAVDWTYAFERQWLYYMLWGRLLYNPDTPDAVFQAAFNRRYGRAGDNLLRAYELASSAQLALASLYDARWDFTLYSEGFLALQGDTTRYISVDTLIGHPTMDPDYISVGDYVDMKIAGQPVEPHRISPVQLAGQLEENSREALRLVENTNTDGNPSLLYEVADVKIWANLGLHLASKIRGAVALQTFRLQGGEAHREAAIAALESALGYWDEVIRISRPLYSDMPLTHYNHNFFEANDDNLFHWELIRDEVAEDVEIARRARMN
jgi:hypothetical protein